MRQNFDITWSELLAQSNDWESDVKNSVKNIGFLLHLDDNPFPYYQIWLSCNYLHTFMILCIIQPYYISFNAGVDNESYKAELSEGLFHKADSEIKKLVFIHFFGKTFVILTIVIASIVGIVKGVQHYKAVEAIKEPLIAENSPEISELPVDSTEII